MTFPLVTHIVRTIASKAMEDRADELIKKIETAPNDLALIRKLKELQSEIFFRVSIIKDETQVIYDSHKRHLLGPRFSHEYIVDNKEVADAFEYGVGRNEDFGGVYDQKFTFFAKAFPFHQKTYVMRTAFPSRYLSDLKEDLEIGFLALTIVMLLLFCIMTWLIISHFTRPIHHIIRAIAPYQEGKQTTIPEISISSKNGNSDFDKLSMTLNSLSAKIQKHIDSLIQERNEKEAILESLMEGVIAVDNAMQVTYVNQMALQLLNVAKEAIFKQNYIAANESQGFALLMSSQKEQKTLSATITLITPSNKAKIYLDLVAVPIGDGKGGVLVMQDRSWHYKLLEMRKDFIANASHELKTPTTIIHGFAEMLYDHPELKEETKRDMIAKILKNSTRMTVLIRDLLTLSDIDNLPLSRLQTCDLKEIVKDCFHTLQDKFKEAIFTLTAGDDEMTLVADHSLLELAMLNLIENGAKYSRGIAHIDVSLNLKTAVRDAKLAQDLELESLCSGAGHSQVMKDRPTVNDSGSRDCVKLASPTAVFRLKHTEHQIEVKVTDRGIGIPAEDLEFIFDRFFTVNKAHSKGMGGSGLGLSIVQTIIQKHFGQISVTSEVGKGTTFTIYLPYAT